MPFNNWSSAKLGDHLLLADPKSGCVGVLNPLSAWILEASNTGMHDEEIAATLATHFGLDVIDTRADVRRVSESLEELREQSVNACPRQVKPAPAHDEVIAFEPRYRSRLHVGQYVLDLEVQSHSLHAGLAAVLSHMQIESSSRDGLIQLRGNEAYWQIVFNGAVHRDGQGLDEAICQTISELAEIGCDIPDRQLVLHGAGVCLDGRGVLLIGVGGSGKTTLVAALNTAGFDLLNDDVVAATRNGELSSAHISLCLKPGSWPVLDAFRSDVSDLEVLVRDGCQVKFLPPLGNKPGMPVVTSAFIFPVFGAGLESRIEELAPWETLQGVIEAESFIPDLDQARLEALAEWVSSAPGFRIFYRDIESGMNLVSQLVKGGSSL